MRRAIVRVGAALVVAVTLLAAGCGAGDPPTPEPPDVEFTVTVQRDADALRISYTLRNRSDAPVVAFAGVPARDTHESPVVDPDAVYVTARDEQTVEVAKRVFAPPEGVGLAVDFVVRGAVVPPGQSLAESIRVPRRLTARHPYDQAAALPAAPQRVVFCLGVARQDAVAPVPAATGDPDSRPVYPHRASVAAAQHLVCGDPAQL